MCIRDSLGVDHPPGQPHPAALADLGDLGLGRHGVTNIDRAEELERHLGGQEGPQAAQMGEQTGRQQAGDDATAELGLGHVAVIGVVGVDVPRHADEQRRVGLGQGAAEGGFGADAGFANDALGEDGCRHRITFLPDLRRCV